MLGMAMAALGINVNFKAIASRGKKPMLASFLTSILLMCFAAGVAMLVVLLISAPNTNRRRRTTVSNWNVSPKITYLRNG